MIRPPMFPAVFSSSGRCERSESTVVFPDVAKLLTARPLATRPRTVSSVRDALPATVPSALCRVCSHASACVAAVDWGVKAEIGMADACAASAAAASPGGCRFIVSSRAVNAQLEADREDAGHLPLSLEEGRWSPTGRSPGSGSLPLGSFPRPRPRWILPTAPRLQ